MGDGSAEATTVNIVELEESLQLEISPEKMFSANESCIFKTPNILFRHNRNAYVPDAFSIGPMHHEKPHLRATHKIKSLYLNDFLKRGITLNAVIKAVEEVEPLARACYAESVDYTPHQLVKILVVDGCFLVELFNRTSQPLKYRNDPIRTMACMYQYLCHDLVLLENQIPWLVLKAVFALLPTDPGSGSGSLESLVITYFSCHFSTKNTLKEPSSVGYKCKHVLDLIRESLIAPFKGKPKQPSWMRMRSAVALSEAGVNIHKPELINANKSIFEVTFDKNKGVLEIPHLMIQETTETTFRNLISYEQCYPNCEHIVTSYVILMDNLIDTSKDLDKLCEAEVIENWLDPQEATQMFNNLYNDASVNEFYYMDLCTQVETYCKRSLPRWRAAYVHNYFSKPWAILSQVVGAIVLVLTILQTVFTIYSPS